MKHTQFAALAATFLASVTAHAAAIQLGGYVLVGIFITGIVPWSSGNSPVGADWFELTNTVLAH